MLKHLSNNEKGFTLIEIAIVMVIIGLLAGGGVSLMGMLSERRIRNETSEYLNDAKNALINYAKIHGRLPSADSDGDGDQDSGTYVGTFPYLDLSFRPTDSNKRVLRYELNSNLESDRATCCSALIQPSGLSGSPSVRDSDAQPPYTAFSIAAVLISAGPKDADGDGNVFDAITTGSITGDNRNGNPNYIRNPPNNTFDDLVVYISGYEIYGEICGDHPELTVINSSTTGKDVFVYNTSQSIDIRKVEPGETKYCPVISGEKFELWTAAGRSGSLVTSEFIVSGSGFVLDVSP
jgi:prepilin-type N-terminal cleavage/methylation domain-containing protein